MKGWQADILETDRTITANRPDIFVRDSVNSTCKLIDDYSIRQKHHTRRNRKESKYKDLELEIQRIYI